MSDFEEFLRKSKQEDMDGYRVPDIKEFIDGFEYEVHSEGYYIDSIEDYWGWYDYKYNIGTCWRDIDQIKRELKSGNIRVKI